MHRQDNNVREGGDDAEDDGVPHLEGEQREHRDDDEEEERHLNRGEGTNHG